MQWICEKIGEPNPPDPLKPGSIMEWNRNPPQDVSGEYHTCTTFFEGAEAPLPARHIVRKYINGRSAYLISTGALLIRC